MHCPHIACIWICGPKRCECSWWKTLFTSCKQKVVQHTSSFVTSKVVNQQRQPPTNTTQLQVPTFCRIIWKTTALKQSVFQHLLRFSRSKSGTPSTPIFSSFLCTARNSRFPHNSLQPARNSSCNMSNAESAMGLWNPKKSTNRRHWIVFRFSVQATLAKSCIIWSSFGHCQAAWITMLNSLRRRDIKRKILFYKITLEPIGFTCAHLQWRIMFQRLSFWDVDMWKWQIIGIWLLSRFPGTKNWQQNASPMCPRHHIKPDLPIDLLRVQPNQSATTRTTESPPQQTSNAEHVNTTN